MDWLDSYEEPIEKPNPADYRPVFVRCPYCYESGYLSFVGKNSAKCPSCGADIVAGEDF